MKKAINIIMFVMLSLWLVYYFAWDKILPYLQSKFWTEIQLINTSTWSQNISWSTNDIWIDTWEFDRVDFGTWWGGNYVDYISRNDVSDTTEDKYIYNKDFVWLYIYYQKRLAWWKEVKVDKFLNTILNLPTDKLNYEAYISILDKLLKDDKITKSEHEYYKTFGNIMQLKFDEFNHDINLINYSGLSQDKIKFIQSIYDSNNTYKWYKNPPKYYLIALMWSNLLTNGYYEPARRLSTEILKINESYILTNQIMAYYNFIMSKNDYAQQFLEKLIKLDDINGDFYKFLLGITYYEWWKYNEAIWILQNITKSDYLDNINKYLLSSYLHIWDRNNAKIIIQNMTKNDTMDIYDYQLVRQYLFYPSNSYEEWYFGEPGKYSYYQSNTDFAKQLVSYCSNYKNGDEVQNGKVCKLWRFGIEIAESTNTGDISYIVDKITSDGNPWVDYVYAWIGDYYTYIWRKDLAKQYYIQSYKSSDDEQYRNNLKSKVIQLFQK